MVREKFFSKKFLLDIRNSVQALYRRYLLLDIKSIEGTKVSFRGETFIINPHKEDTPSIYWITNVYQEGKRYVFKFPISESGVQRYTKFGLGDIEIKTSYSIEKSL